MADEELRGRGREREQSQAGAKAEDQITPPPVNEGRGEGVLPDLLALLSAFCAAGQSQKRVLRAAAGGTGTGTG